MGRLKVATIQEESNVLPSQRDRNVSPTPTGMECSRDRSRLKYMCDRLLMMLLNSKRVKKVMIIMDKSFMARMSPKS